MTGVPAPKPPAPPARPAAPRAGSALRRSRLKPARPLKLRLMDAVALSAGGLLLLKVLTLSQTGLPIDGNLPDFGRALAKARTGYEIPDPATTGSVAAKESPKEGAKPPERPPEPPQAQPALPDPVSPAERALLEKLGARRDALRQRSDELDLREKMLNDAERKLETGLGDLKQAEDKVDAAAKAKEAAQRDGLKSIVTMYETMKPKEAARVFDRLGHDVLVPLVVAMNPRKMAEILAVMQPETAERLTVALANRARGVGGAQAQTAAGLPPGELPAIDPSAIR
ncbi:hypothetical protein Q8W71_18165 [Methylobacterium sp. NEAU 140]|uniref:MotE family protein n=1 Tax=Methylobacterium sp. NEAU 140 TaxID=3064945 RepID=UPI002732B828|nr:hypothetical protein [Methylobacterium sp. NEAU 140]MDP4024553.1 hypothetical protein [Methylobacterium sp. NEAU 140]